MDTSSITPTPRQLRALTHPVRLRILGLLRTEGPTTATALASRLGLNTGATSYHLRQLATHGFIVDDASLGTGRERWWRAAHAATRNEWELPDADPADQEALDAYLQSVVVVYTRMLQQMIEERATLPHEWRSASTVSDWRVRLNPERARQLIETVAKVIEAFPDADESDAEAVHYTVMFHGFPRPGGDADTS
ncbi:helix-turn-helix domain-containing protein [Solirubrobacter phytolaccae]|uniref:Helix-turn-helix domain-containing protein n=1 Tax=Solirubrobacter phytolaccae TaxID=1404360 RepID=A0A9X3NC54_9ACTN|nr:helix-turn-helix domain-containing protein [Solirubrobacter phytolaccae]MDA0183970.1 helix-turn-helix domain-containing protein [Solirubrobacter phytolaccae]